MSSPKQVQGPPGVMLETRGEPFLADPSIKDNVLKARVQRKSMGVFSL